ncbi:glutamine--fructose-6-phosphate transaminase (isomerizing) [Methanobrevibacter sp. DSM 116169]|uniref:glutamine--fructose-6-phosphate transaminase (isomerizing) n=1 Tax=Methanobrevibacter sp. DSM 116169 TaxID=3242727 RepID=UPI0038FD12B8
MCGIVGCILKNNRKAAPILLDSISKLEYRGYDSIGIATIDNNKIFIKKDEGNIETVDNKLDLADMDGDYGIAHVRWATHGDPNKVNSHPHTSQDEKIAVVHNGIIENYVELKEQLENEGYEFKSDTDTEVIPQLISKYMSKGFDLESAVRETITMIEGAYAIAAICTDEKKIVATRKDSPLIVGLGKKGYFVASDSPAILKYAKDIIYPEKDELVILTENEIVIKDEYDNIIEKEIETIDWSPEMAEKEGYDYFMLKEINEQSTAVKNTLTGKKEIEKIVSKIKGNINRIIFVACGTSYHASLTGKYLIETLAGIPTEVILASEFKYSTKTLDDKTLVIFISQSGETADTLKALEAANKTSQTLAIVNVVGSSATRQANHVIYTQAGPEIGVAATKTYLSQLTSIYMFAAILSGNEYLFKDLNKIPKYIDEILEDTTEIELVSKKFKYADDFFFIGRGYAYPIALEGALKLKEITYIHGEGYAAGELKHGPLALIDQNIPVVVVAPPGDNNRKTMSNLEEVKSRGADVFAVGSFDDESLRSKSDDIFCINPDVDEILAPLVYIVPLQLLSYYVAIERKLDPDKPRNLAKCVTVE